MSMCLYLASPADKMFHMSIFSKSSRQNFSCVYLQQVQHHVSFFSKSSRQNVHVSIFSKSSRQNVSCDYLLQVQLTKCFMCLSFASPADKMFHVTIFGRSLLLFASKRKQVFQPNFPDQMKNKHLLGGGGFHTFDTINDMKY